MADFSNLKINERLNVQRLNLGIAKIGNKIQKIDLYQQANMRIGEIVSSAEYRMDEPFQNCQFWIFGIPNWKKSRNLLIFQLEQCQRISSLENSKTCQFEKFQKLLNWKIRNILTFENSKNFRFVKF